jgi:hypothetical protein
MKSLLQIYILQMKNQLKAITLHKLSYGMTSKMLYVAAMKIESEFADVYLDFIRKCGIASALRRNNAKSEMSQRVKDIHRLNYC